jgi:hypothetical protein
MKISKLDSNNLIIENYGSIKIGNNFLIGTIR